MTKINNNPRIPLDEFKVMKGTIAHLRSYDDKWRAARGLAPREERPTQPAPAQTSTQTSAPTQTAETVPTQTTPTMSDIIRAIFTGDGTTNVNLNENANAPTNNKAPVNISTMLGIDLDDIKAILSSPIVKDLAKGVKALIAEMLMAPTQETAPTEENAEPVQPTEECAPAEEATNEVPAEEAAIEENATEEVPAEETPVETSTQPENQTEQISPLAAYYKEKLEEYKNGSQKMNEAPVEEKAGEETEVEEKPAPKKRGGGKRSKK